jgi:23S rRNA pseudouridine2604 synthase
MDSAEQVRINVFLARAGVCSRRQADELIRSGRVRINGRPAALGDRVSTGDRVHLDRDRISLKDAPEPIYIALHKPRGIVCTTDRREPDNIVDYLGFQERVFPIGRLDKDSTGLILLTNDGSIVNRILRAQYGHEKEYVVAVNRPLTESFLQAMRSGVPILDTVTRPCRVRQTGKQKFRIILTQGLNRQIRRMCEALEYRVVRLRRVRIMHITLGSLKVGEWRKLTAKEMRDLEMLLQRAEDRSAGEQIC